mgnify:CR=1 FL=1
MLRWYWFRITVLFLFSLFNLVVAADTETQAHEHQGKLIAYTGAPPGIYLDDDELALLEDGQALFKKIQLDKAKRGIAVFRVNADSATIWSVIKDFSSYPEWINDIEAIDVYKQEQGMSYVKFTAGGLFGSKTVWYAVHDYPDSTRDWGTWRLDYTHRSDLDDAVGFWRVIPVAGKSNQSDVIYSADLKLKGFFTSLFETALIDSSLRDATEWVKVQAEARVVK